MFKVPYLLSGVAIATCLGAMATPAMAGKADRARAAIAEASGKIDAVDKAGVAGEAPRLTAEAQATLRSAQENLKSGHKETAIKEANHASKLADIALGESQKRKIDADAAATRQCPDAN